MEEYPTQLLGGDVEEYCTQLRRRVKEYFTGCKESMRMTITSKQTDKQHNMHNTTTNNNNIDNTT